MIFDGNKDSNIKKASELLRSGELVAFPTETVYGLGADGFNRKAVSKIFQVKQRPFEDPLILHIADVGRIKNVVREFPKEAEILARKFWPGPLTLILPKASEVPFEVTAGLSTVGVRVPSHPVARKLLEEFGGPIAAPSANRFQHISPTTAQAVEKELGESVSMILDGGPCSVGIESTIVSFENEVQILRLGGVTVESLSSVLGFRPQVVTVWDRKELPAPGLMEKHYSPKTPLKVFSSSEIVNAIHQLSGDEKSGIFFLGFSREQAENVKKGGVSRVDWLSEKGNLEEAANSFYSKLRLADESGVRKIWAVWCPNTGLGMALNDRLQKAQEKEK